LGSVGAGSEKRNGRAGLAVDCQLVAADVDSVDQEAVRDYALRLGLEIPKSPPLPRIDALP